MAWLTRVTGSGHEASRLRPSERTRVPPPVIRRRLPSGRGAMEQPNCTGDGDAPLTPRFWLVLVVAGIATGLFGAFLMAILYNVSYLAFGYHGGSFQTGVEHATGLRRVVSLVVAGVIGAVAWYLVRHFLQDENAQIDDAVWSGDGQLSLRRAVLTSIISEFVIGMGASLGREAAPKLTGGATASALGTWFKLSPAQRRLLVACAGGAGLGAVYNVPLAGALFTAEILVGSLSLPVVLPALACSWVATVASWVYLPRHAAYVGVPDYRFSMTILVWAVLVGPVIGAIATGFIRLIGWVSHHRVSGAGIMVAMPLAFGALGVIGIWYPELFGNGKDMAYAAFLGRFTVPLLLALFLLKPLVTSACLGAVRSGGLLTPTMSTGAMFGGMLGSAWNLLWPGSPSGAFAMVGAAAMIGASMQAPLTALSLILELTHSGFGLLVPMLAATVTATAMARYLDGYSIYSARLTAA